MVPYIKRPIHLAKKDVIIAIENVARSNVPIVCHENEFADTSVSFAVSGEACAINLLHCFLPECNQTGWVGVVWAWSTVTSKHYCRMKGNRVWATLDVGGLA